MDAIFHLSNPFIAVYGLIAFKKYLQLVEKRFTAHWGQKNYKDRRILMKNYSELEKNSNLIQTKKHLDERAS